MIVDLCLGSSWDESPVPSLGPALNQSSTSLRPDTHICRSITKLPGSARVLNTSGVLQVGGLVPTKVVSDGAKLPRPPHFHGCIRNIRVNGKVSVAYQIFPTNKTLVVSPLAYPLPFSTTRS